MIAQARQVWVRPFTRPAASISRNGTLWNTAGSFRPDIARADHFTPLLDFVGDQLSAVCGRAWQRPCTHLGESGLEFRIGKSRVDLSIQPVDDISRRVFGRAHAVPCACLVASHEIANRWEIG